MLLDLTNVTENGGPVPNGTYNVIVDKAEVKPTNKGGEQIKAQLRIIDGNQTGRIIFDSWNTKNENPKAVQIGLGQLKTMLKAFGHPNPNMLSSTTELLGLKGTVTTRIEEKEGYNPQARVRAYKPLAGETTQAAAIQKDPFS